jgi:hypothetical protein
MIMINVFILNNFIIWIFCFFILTLFVHLDLNRLDRVNHAMQQLYFCTPFKTGRIETHNLIDEISYLATFNIEFFS